MLHVPVKMVIELAELALEHVDLRVDLSDAAKVEIVVTLHRVDHLLNLLAVVLKIVPSAGLWLALIVEPC